MDVRAVLARDAHRPWPLPGGRWSMTQSWHDLLFAHWPVAPAVLRPLLPEALEVDTYDGAGWLGVVPFRMSGVRPRGTPAVPWLSAFPELNVRTYVRGPDGCAGVWFFSLDAARWIAVQVARRWFRLPYFHARMRCTAEGDALDYASVRIHRGAPAARLRARYRPTGPVALATPGTLEHFLTERYRLYTLARDGGVRAGDIHHVPWPLQPAECELAEESMARAAGVPLPATAPHLLFARRLDVVVWSLRPT